MSPLCIVLCISLINHSASIRVPNSWKQQTTLNNQYSRPHQVQKSNIIYGKTNDNWIQSSDDWVPIIPLQQSALKLDLTQKPKSYYVGPKKHHYPKQNDFSKATSTSSEEQYQSPQVIDLTQKPKSYYVEPKKHHYPKQHDYNKATSTSSEEHYESPHEVPLDLPTRPIYPGEGHWAKKGKKHQPYIRPKEFKPSPQFNEPKPDGYDIFEKQNNKFERLKNGFNVPSYDSDSLKDSSSSEENVSQESAEDTFTPYRMYSQVRKTESENHLPMDDSDNERLREVVKDSKIQTVYTEEGYEDSAYDHGAHIKNAEHDEGYANFNKDIENDEEHKAPVKLNDSTEDQNIEGSQSLPLLSEKATNSTKIRRRRPVVKKRKKQNFISTKETNTMSVKDQGNGTMEMEVESELKLMSNPGKITKKHKFVKIYPKHSPTKSKTQEMDVLTSDKKNSTVPNSPDQPTQDSATLEAAESVLKKIHSAYMTSKRTKRSPSQEKYPYYQNSNIPLDENSPLRYSQNLDSIPQKSSQNLAFYEANSDVQCAEVDDSTLNPIPEHITDSNEDDSSTEAGVQRLGNLGDKIDCFKNKYFGKNPLDSPIFQEELIQPPIVPMYKTNEMKYAGFKIENVPKNNKFDSKIHKANIKKYHSRFSRPATLLTTESTTLSPTVNEDILTDIIGNINTFQDVKTSTNLNNLDTTEISTIPPYFAYSTTSRTYENVEYTTFMTELPKIMDETTTSKESYESTLKDNIIESTTTRIPIISLLTTPKYKLKITPKHIYDQIALLNSLPLKNNTPSSTNNVPSTNTVEILPSVTVKVDNSDLDIDNLSRANLTPQQIYQVAFLKYLAVLNTSEDKGTETTTNSVREAKSIDNSLETSTEIPASLPLRYRRRKKVRPPPPYKRPLYHIFDERMRSSTHNIMAENRVTSFPHFTPVTEINTEVLPSEQLNVFADILNNIKNASNDPAYIAATKFYKPITLQRKSPQQDLTRVSQVANYLNNIQNTNSFYLTTSSTTSTPKPYRGAIKFKNEEIYDDYLSNINHESSGYGKRQHVTTTTTSTTTPKNNIEDNLIAKTSYVPQISFSNHNLEGLVPPGSTWKYKTIVDQAPSNSEVVDVQVATTELNNYFFEGMKPPSSTEIAHSYQDYMPKPLLPSFVPQNNFNLGPNHITNGPVQKPKRFFEAPLPGPAHKSKQMPVHRLKRKPPPRRRYRPLRRSTRGVNRASYFELSRGSDKTSSSTKEEEEDDYVPHRSKNYHYDEVLKKIVYDSPQPPKEKVPSIEEEDEEEDEEEPEKEDFGSIQQTTTKRVFTTRKPIEGPSYVDFISALKKNPKYQEIPDPTTTTANPNATTTTEKTKTVTSGIVPEFLGLLSKVRNSETYQVIEEPKTKKGSATSTTESAIYEDEEEEEEEEPLKNIQNSRGGMFTPNQDSDSSDYNPNTKNYSPSTSIDYSKYKTISRPKSTTKNEEDTSEEEEESDGVAKRREQLLTPTSTTTEGQVEIFAVGTTSTAKIPTTKRRRPTTQATTTIQTVAATFPTRRRGTTRRTTEAPIVRTSTEAPHEKTTSSDFAKSKRVYPRKRPARIRARPSTTTSSTNDPEEGHETNNNIAARRRLFLNRANRMIALGDLEAQKLDNSSTSAKHDHVEVVHQINDTNKHGGNYMKENDTKVEKEGSRQEKGLGLFKPDGTVLENINKLKEVEVTHDEHSEYDFVTDEKPNTEYDDILEDYT